MKLFLSLLIALGTPALLTAKNVTRSLKPGSDGSWQESGYFEGDIVPTWETISSAYGEEFARKMGLSPPTNDAAAEGEPEIQHGAGHKDGIRYWIDEWHKSSERYTIRVHFDEDYTQKEKNDMKKYLNQLSSKTGVVRFAYQWKKPTNGKPFISIIRSSGCWSYVGQYRALAVSPDGQPLSIGHGCLWRSTVQHEMMHAMGFYHEQSRPDRDEFVTINYENIQEGREGNFRKATNSEVDSLGVKYDYASIMHYSPHAFNNGGGETITAHDGNTIMSSGLVSFKDVMQIRLMYQCKAKNGRPFTRHVSKYYDKAARCNQGRCKCGKGWEGCASNSECKGNLVCRNKKCQAP